MNKKIVSGLAVIAIMALPIIALAQAPGSTTLNFAKGPGYEVSSINDLVGAIEGIMWIVFGTLAVIMFVVAGILFLTAQGAPEKVSAARAAFIWGVAGIVVAIIAYSIIQIVSSMIHPS